MEFLFLPFFLAGYRDVMQLSILSSRTALECVTEPQDRYIRPNNRDTLLLLLPLQSGIPAFREHTHTHRSACTLVCALSSRCYALSPLPCLSSISSDTQSSNKATISLLKETEGSSLLLPRNNDPDDRRLAEATVKVESECFVRVEYKGLYPSISVTLSSLIPN